MIRIGQHFCHFDFACFREPAVENFKEKVALKIDKYRLRIFVAPCRAAASQRPLSLANVNITWQFPLRAQTFDRQNEIAGDAIVISGAQFFSSHNPRAPLHDHFSATQPRHLRRHTELKRVKAERDSPRPRKRPQILAIALRKSDRATAHVRSEEHTSELQSLTK